MNIVRLGRKKWEVLAICADRDPDECAILELIYEYDALKKNRPTNTFLYRITEYIPEYGPEIHNKSKAKKVSGAEDIWELLQKTSKGGTPRIYYFLDGDKTIVFAVANIKKGERKVQQKIIRQAQEVRRAYKVAKANNQIFIQDLEGN